MEIFVAKSPRCAYRSVNGRLVARTATAAQENAVTLIIHVPIKIVII
jgi:hypothetical protein